MFRIARAAFFAVLSACAAVGAAPAATVVFFDDFNDDAIMRGDKPGMELINWRVTSGYVDVIGSSHDRTWSEFWAGHGAYVDLDGTGKLAGRIETKATFELVLGEVYEFSFDYAKSHQGAEAISYGVGGFSGELLLPQGPKHNFVRFTTTFLAMEQFVTIFLAGHGGDDIGAKVDNVGLFGPLAVTLALAAPAASPAAAVPVPGSLIFLASALIGLAALRRRR